MNSFYNNDIKDFQKKKESFIDESEDIAKKLLALSLINLVDHATDILLKSPYYVKEDGVNIFRHKFIKDKINETSQDKLVEIVRFRNKLAHPYRYSMLLNNKTYEDMVCYMNDFEKEFTRLYNILTRI